jgi:hypothetical protein
VRLVRGRGWFDDEDLVQVRCRPVRCLVVPAAVAGQDLQGGHPGGHDVQVERPHLGQLLEVGVGLGELKAAVEEGHWCLGGGLSDQVEHDQGVLAAGEGDVALVLVQVRPDPAPDQVQVAAAGA